MNITDPPHALVHRTAAGTAIWWTIDQFCRYGPSWSLVPPILIGIASCVGAYSSWRKTAQELRHAEQLHAIKLAAEQRRLSLESISAQGAS